jgi:hypothetical protein
MAGLESNARGLPTPAAGEDPGEHQGFIGVYFNMSNGPVHILCWLLTHPLVSIKLKGACCIILVPRTPWPAEPWGPPLEALNTAAHPSLCAAVPEKLYASTKMTLSWQAQRVFGAYFNACIGHLASSPVLGGPQSASW